MAAEKDLLHFPLYFNRIINSEVCAAMTTEEFGAYMWLMIHAAAKEKEVSLPPDTQALAQLAKLKKLSPRVLEQFPEIKTEWGTRRRNAVQFTIWEKSQVKVARNRAAANKKWEIERQKKEDANANA